MSKRQFTEAQATFARDIETVSPSLAAYVRRMFDAGWSVPEMKEKIMQAAALAGKH